MIPYGRQNISQEDINSVVDVLKSDFLTQGNVVPNFEAKIQEYCNVSNAVAVNSATSGLHIACLALGVKHGDIVWTSPISFVASANCALYCGASIDFIDIDPLSYNLNIDALTKKLEIAKENGTLPKVVIPVHLTGQSCDMLAISKLSKIYNFKIIEDASHCIGGSYLNNKIGSCEYSDISVFSFHPVKIVTSGEGGAAVTNSAELDQKLKLLRAHGITRDLNLMQFPQVDAWYYEQIELGFNYRLAEIPAALGISQMRRLDNFVSRRHILQERYHQMLSDFPLTLPFQSQDCHSALHLYPIQIDLSRLNKTHSMIFNELRENGLGVNLHYIPIYKQPYYQNLGYKVSDYPNTENYYNRAISIPLFYSMTNKQQDEVVQVLKKVLK